jgi:hypothetical protein
MCGGLRVAGTLRRRPDALCGRSQQDSVGYRLSLPYNSKVLYYNNIAKILIGEHPSTWSVYTNSYADRHNREYTPFEVKRLLECGGFSIQRLTTYMLIHQRGKRRVLGQMAALLSAAFRRVPLELRQEKIFVLASKSGQVIDRFPMWLYTLYGRTGVTVSPRSALLSSPDA